MPLYPTRREQRTDARRQREARTVQLLVRLYCRHHHGRQPQGEALCPACATLLAYANERLARCRFLPDKPTCRRCPIHCYRSAQREAMRQVMRYAGPRLLFVAPRLALQHLLDDLKTPKGL